MNSVLAILLAILLIGVNAFFVGAEFALISARRDRLEALAEQGRARAVTVIRAGEQLPAMLAGAQLGVTVASLLLGRMAEPAVAGLLRTALGFTGMPAALLHTLAFVVALALVVTLHVLLGEMVPKNIALAGPERTAMLLVPAYLPYVRAARPIIVFYNKCANGILRALGVQPKDELDMSVSTVELSDMIAESLSEGLLDHEEHRRLTRALRVRTRVVADVAVPLSNVHAVSVAAPGSGPTIGAVEQALAQTGYSRFPVVDSNGEYIGYLHIKDVLAFGDDPHTVIDLTLVRALPRVPGSLVLPDALSRMRRSNSHLALVTAELAGVGPRAGGGEAKQGPPHEPGGSARLAGVGPRAGGGEAKQGPPHEPGGSARLAGVGPRAGGGEAKQGPPHEPGASHGEVVAVVALEDLVEDLVGTMRDGAPRDRPV